MTDARHLLFLFVLVGFFSCTDAGNQSITFEPDDGVILFKNFNELPDSMGILSELPLSLPPFVFGGCFSGDGGGPGFLPGNRNHLWLVDSDYKILNEPDYGKSPPFYLLRSPAGRLGTFSVFHLDDGQYLCLLPLSGNHSMSWIEFNEGTDPVLKIGSLGTARVKGKVPAIAWAKSDNIYEASYKVWKKVLDDDLPGVFTDWPDKKEYPEFFEYLGWCTWEEFNRDINDSLIIDAVGKINGSLKF